MVKYQWWLQVQDRIWEVSHISALAVHPGGWFRLLALARGG